MKKLLLTLFVILPIIGFSQTRKGNFVIGVEGNFSKDQQALGGFSNNFNSINKGGNISTAFGYYLQENFEIGIGIDYYFGNDETQSMLNNGSVMVENFNVKSRLLMPKIYFRYGKEIIPKLSINGNIQFAYGKLKQDSKSSVIRIEGFPVESSFSTPSINSLTEFDDKENAFMARIHPELEYDISSRFSFSLKMGGLYYQKIGGDNSEASYRINFNPNDWVMGLRMHF